MRAGLLSYMYKIPEFLVSGCQPGRRGCKQKALTGRKEKI